MSTAGSTGRPDGLAPMQDVRAEMLRGAQSLATAAPPSRERGITSDLSVDEALLLHAAGWEPLDLVCGVAVVSVPVGVWNWGQEAPSPWPRTRTTPPWTRPPACCAPSAPRCTGTAWSGSGSRCRCARTTSTSSSWARRCGRCDGKDAPAGHRRRPGHALRVRPVGPRLHPAPARRLDARRARLRRQLRLRPAAHRRHGHEADDAERRADQLHRGHVLGPGVGHGEDAALRAGGRAARAWSRSRSPRAR